MELLVANLVGKSYRKVVNGREYIVAPMTLIVPGVLPGSDGPLYYSVEEVTKDPSVWNHVPIVVNHPTANGKPVSARDPVILEKYGIGYVYRTTAKGKLKAEGWFDVEHTKRVDARVYNALEAGTLIELSTGLFLDKVPAPAGSVDSKGRAYSYITTNYRPDHLAVLPDQVGACSIQDGCGVFVNSRNTLLTPLGVYQPDSLYELREGWADMSSGTRQDNCRCSTQDPIGWKPLRIGPTRNATDISLDEMTYRVEKSFRERYPPRYDPETGMRLDNGYVISVFDGYCICRMENELYRITYSVSKEGLVTLDGEPEQVTKVVKYVPVKSA